jgi:hypothetical protein
VHKPQSNKIKNLLSIQEIFFDKKEDDHTINVTIKGMESQLYIVPECKDDNFLDIDRLVGASKIISFVLLWDRSEATTSQLDLICKAFQQSSHLIKELEHTWINKDIREFAKNPFSKKITTPEKNGIN